MTADRRASLGGSAERIIHASPARVWAVLTDIQRWPEWQPGVTFVSRVAPLGVGTTFRWRANGLTIRSTLRELEPGRCMAWTGRALGMTASHVWTLQPHDEGTYVMTQESLSGWLARFMGWLMPEFVARTLQNGLDALKDRVEEESRSEPRPM